MNAVYVIKISSGIREKKCERCKTWYHTTCQDDVDYSLTLHRSWRCTNCDTSNSSTTLFTLHDESSVNEPTFNISFTDTNKMFDPKHSSTPKKPQPKSIVNHRPLRIINVNCQSLCNKKERFINLVDSTKPDIIIATETWLNPTIYSSEFFSSSYNIFRCDRITNTTGGGVLIAINRCYKSEEYVIPKNTNSEIIWVKLTTKGNKRLYIGACYRHEKSDEKTLHDCDDYLQAITKNENNAILLGGDFNLDGWDWEKNVIKPNARYVAIHHLFEDIINNHGLKQIIDEPTRKNTVLHLLITNRPNQINRTEILPGIATGDDHQVVYSELDISLYCTKQQPRKIVLYKADWSGFRIFAKTIAVKIDSMKNKCAIEELWTILKNCLLDGMKRFIPDKIVKAKEWSPWIDRKLQKLIKRRNRAFQASKKTGKLHYEQKFQQLKRKVQKDLRRAYTGSISKISYYQLQLTRTTHYKQKSFGNS